MCCRLTHHILANARILWTFDKLTDRARGFLQAAQTIAVREHHQRMTPAHYVKALLDDEQGMAVGLINAAGGNSEAERGAPSMHW